MTVQPAIGDPFFEMEDARRWFAKRYAKVDPADLMSLSALDPPPGYADLQEQMLRKSGKGSYWVVFWWHHFRMYRDGGPPTLAVICESRRGPKQILNADGTTVWADYQTTWRVWLYEHRQGLGTRPMRSLEDCAPRWYWRP
jgi:hypothetical protein